MCATWVAQIVRLGAGSRHSMAVTTTRSAVKVAMAKRRREEAKRPKAPAVPQRHESPLKGLASSEWIQVGRRSLHMSSVGLGFLGHGSCIQ